MRVVVTIILRLLEDSDLPKDLRGTLQRIPGRRTYPFACREELLSLLDLNSCRCDLSGSDLPGVTISPDKPDGRNDDERRIK